MSTEGDTILVWDVGSVGSCSALPAEIHAWKSSSVSSAKPHQAAVATARTLFQHSGNIIITHKFILSSSKVAKPKDAHKWLVLQVYLGSNTYRAGGNGTAMAVPVLREKNGVAWILT